MKKEKQQKECIIYPHTKMHNDISKKRTRGCFFSLAVIIGIPLAIITSIGITIAGLNGVNKWKENRFTYHEATRHVFSYECFYFHSYKVHKWNHRPDFKLIDKDSYGRRLYCFSANGYEDIHIALSDYYGGLPGDQSSSKVYLILQKKTKKDAYYYQGESLYFSIDFFKEKENIEKLKVKNDWGKPFEKEKSVKISEYPPDFDQTIVGSALQKYLRQNWEDSYIGAVYDAEQRPIYIARETNKLEFTGHPTEDLVTFKKSYAFTLNEQNEVETCIELTGDPNDWIQQMESLRRTANSTT